MPIPAPRSRPARIPTGPMRAPALALLLTVFAALVLAHPAAAQDLGSAPEAATDSTSRTLAFAERHMVSAANRYAADAGREILRAGGSAVDGAIAVQLVLNLVEPQSSGLGGGAFVLYWDAGKSELTTFDARETAPASATPDRFLIDGKPMPFQTAVRSGLSVGVPGIVRLMETVHARYGRLPWARLFEPAIRLAETGFEVSPRLHLLLRAAGPESFVPEARRYFFTGTGNAWPIGYVLKNPELAATLKRIAAEGARGFYEGPVAEAIVKAVAEAPTAAGGMTLQDLAGYAVKERTPVCFGYRGNKACSVGPPSSGGLTVAQTLTLLEPFDLGKGRAAALQPQAMHLIAEAEKLAYADRNRYLADPDFVAIPDGLLDPQYLAERRALIDPLHAMERPKAGVPPGAARQPFGSDATRERAGTSHISIIDDDGNALAMTTTIEGGFGSHNWAAGFLLNNELTDFSFVPVDADGQPVANAVAAGKRPRSSMAPTIVLDDAGRVMAVLGSPGGGRIILFVVKTLVALIDWGMDAQAAADLLNFGSQGDGFEIELDRAAIWPALGLKAFGHRIVPDDMSSGTHVIVRRGSRLEGGADARREGAALGD
jgi:gamma-glutamyltranspeptidase / glutathione hydrolase